MYYNRSYVTLDNVSPNYFLSAPCDLEFKYKKRVEEYDDLNGNKRYVRDGYDLSIFLTYRFKEDEFDDETELRDIVNNKTLDALFIDIYTYYTDVQVYIKEENIKDVFDEIKVEIDCGKVPEMPTRTGVVSTTREPLTQDEVDTAKSSRDSIN